MDYSLKATGEETGDLTYIYQNELDIACHQQDMAYGDFKDLPKRTAADKELCDKTFNIAWNSKYDGYQRKIAWNCMKLCQTSK